MNFFTLLFASCCLQSGCYGDAQAEPIKQRRRHCPRRVLAQTAKTRGGTLEVPAYRDENLAVAGKISIFQEQGSQRIAEKYAKDCRNFAGGRIE